MYRVCSNLKNNSGAKRLSTLAKCDFHWVSSISLRKEHDLRCSETHVLSRVFGTQKHETRIGRIQLRDEELDNLHLSSNFIRISQM